MLLFSLAMEVCCLHGRSVSKYHYVLHVVILCLQLATLKAQNAQVVSFEGDRALIPVGESVTLTCAVNMGQVEWKFSPEGRSYTLNTFSFMGIVSLEAPDEGTNVSINSSTDDEGNYISKLTIPSSIVPDLNNTDVTCSAKTSLIATATGEQLLRIKVFSSPTSPRNLRVVLESDLEVTLAWDPSFLPFNITPQYKVYVDGVKVAIVDQPSFTLSRTERSCDPRKIVVKAFNEVGSSNSSELLDVTLPSVPEVNGLAQSISSLLSKSSGQPLIIISFEQATSCNAHPVTNYSVTVSSNVTAPVTVVEQAPSSQEVSVTVGGLSENTLYTYHISANNAIGSTHTGNRTFYTTDVHKVTAMEMKEGTLSISCEFVQGSNALGCQVTLETSTRVGNLTHMLYRDMNSARVEKVIDINVNLSCYHRVVVFDIESDNTTSELGVPGYIQANQSRPCTAPLRPEDGAAGLPLALIIGISVGVALLLVIVVTILVVICCLLKNTSLRKGSSVKDNSVYFNDDSYVVRYSPEAKRSSRPINPSAEGPQENQLPVYDSANKFRPPSTEGPQENQLPVYDSVDKFRPMSTESACQDYQLLRRDLGRSLPLSSSAQAQNGTYACLNTKPCTERIRSVPLSCEPYEVPAYAQPFGSPEPVYQTLDDSITTGRVPKKTPPTTPTTPPPSYYSEVADALPSSRRVKPIGRSSTITLPQRKSPSRTSLTQV